MNQVTGWVCFPEPHWSLLTKPFATNVSLKLQRYSF